MRLAVRLLALGLLGLALLLAANMVLVDRATKPADADGGQVLDLPGGDLHLREDGDRSQRAMVLIHGWTASLHWWDRLVPRLASRRVVRVDLLGHGGSEKPRDGYSMEEQAERVALALRALRLGRATVVGHSTGGEVAIALASAHPELVERLVVMDTETDEDDVDVDTETKLTVTPVVGEALWRLVTDAQIRDGLKQAFASDGFPVPEQFVEDVNRMTFSSYKKTWDESADYVDEGRLATDFRESKMDAMIIFGREDRLVDPASAQGYEALRSVRVELVDGAGHSPMVEKPDAVARLLLDFDRRRPAVR